MSACKDFRPVLAELRNQGWTTEQTRQGHWKAVPPDKSKSIVHFSASAEPRALKNTLQDLRKNGFVWPPVKRPSSPGQAPVDQDDFDLLDIDAPLSEPPVTQELPTEPREAKMDRLYNELKDAKNYYGLTVEQLAECREKLAAAQKAFDEATAEKDRAGETLRAKKAEFDQVFSQAA